MVFNVGEVYRKDNGQTYTINAINVHFTTPDNNPITFIHCKESPAIEAGRFHELVKNGILSYVHELTFPKI